MSIRSQKKRILTAYRSQIREIVVKRARLCLVLAIFLHAVYLVLENSYFHAHLNAYVATKITLIGVFIFCLPLSYLPLFHRHPLHFATALFFIHLLMDSSVFVLSGCHGSYVSSFIIALLFLNIVFPYNHRLYLSLSAATILGFNAAVCIASILPNIVPAQPLDAVFLLNQNLLLTIVGGMVFLKSLIEDQLKFSEFVSQKHLEGTKEELEASLQALKQTQVQLVQSEKMASLGRLVAGIGHELNNPINYIYGNLRPLERYIDYLQETAGQRESLPFRAMKSRDEVMQDMKKIISTFREGSIRMRDIIRDLLTFSHGNIRQEPYEIAEAFDVHEGLEKTLNLLQHLFSDRIEIKRRYEVKTPALGVAKHLNQVFMNLLTNAIQSFPNDRGKIEIHTQEIESRHGHRFISISIIDDGRGIDHLHLDRIFEPFFTTKEEGKGTGLGLSMSLSLVKAMGGEIRVRSKLGRGSEFTIVLPRAQEAKEVELAEAAA